MICTDPLPSPTDVEGFRKLSLGVDSIADDSSTDWLVDRSIDRLIGRWVGRLEYGEK